MADNNSTQPTPGRKVDKSLAKQFKLQPYALPNQGTGGLRRNWVNTLTSDNNIANRSGAETLDAMNILIGE